MFLQEIESGKKVALSAANLSQTAFLELAAVLRGGDPFKFRVLLNA
jgi:hypothetical protein